MAFVPVLAKVGWALLALSGSCTLIALTWISWDLTTQTNQVIWARIVGSDSWEGEFDLQRLEISKIRRLALGYVEAD